MGAIFFVKFIRNVMKEDYYFYHQIFLFLKTTTFYDIFSLLQHLHIYFI